MSREKQSGIDPQDQWSNPANAYNSHFCHQKTYRTRREKNKCRTSQRHREVLSAESETEIGFMKWIKPINMIASLEAPRSLDEERSCIIKIQILDIASETIISQGFI